MFKIVGFVCCVLFLSSCASKIGYSPKKGNSPQFDTGYSETKIKKDIYNVHFLGNGNNTPIEVRSFFLKRSGELTLENGFTGFCILKDAQVSAGWANVPWPGHSGDIKFSNQTNEDNCFNANDV